MSRGVHRVAFSCTLPSDVVSAFIDVLKNQVALDAVAKCAGCHKIGGPVIRRKRVRFPVIDANRVPNFPRVAEQPYLKFLPAVEATVALLLDDFLPEPVGNSPLPFADRHPLPSLGRTEYRSAAANQ